MNKGVDEHSLKQIFLFRLLSTGHFQIWDSEITGSKKPVRLNQTFPLKLY